MGAGGVPHRAESERRQRGDRVAGEEHERGGGDAIDTAAKIARRHWILRGQPERVHLLSRTNGYHGTHGFGTAIGA